MPSGKITVSVIEVLYFSDRAVTQKLKARVAAATKLTLVTALPPHRHTDDVASTSPFYELEQAWGDAIDQVLVVDEGKVEGMWRDPVTTVADELYADDSKAAYAAARGYFFVEHGQAVGFVKRSEAAEDDFEPLDALIESLLNTPKAARPTAPPRRNRGAAQTQGTGKRAAKPKPPPTPPSPPPSFDTDPYAVLGLSPNATLQEAKHAWKALLTQYHPDKVAHLAPEFRKLAEEKTRAIMEAWEVIQRRRPS